MAVDSEIVQLEHMIGTLKEKIQLLEKINDRLNRELLLRKKRQMARVGFVLLIISGLSAFLSFYFSSLSLEIATIFAFFIGFFFIFYESEDKISTSVINKILSSALYPLNAVINEMGGEETAFFIPPNRSLTEGRVFIPFEDFNDTWPNFEELSLEKISIEKTGISVIPIGYGLHIQLTRELGLDYRKFSLEELIERLPYVLVDVYELAEEAKIWQDRDYIYFQLEEPKISYGKELGQALFYGPLASPVCSAVALTIAKVIGRYIRVLKTEYDERTNSVMSVYEIGMRAPFE
ncbi:MAG: hypothetical protein JSV20_10470 [Candidatus Bathyarchaeota archaeon]|nr:MAG: hypothetical protein JSV20_10470 [Candidatus Bathyarchaeota archaeon]